MLIAATLIAALAMLVCGLVTGYVYADRLARAAEMAALRAEATRARAEAAEGEKRVRDLVASIQAVHNNLTAQVADLNDRLSLQALGRAPSSNPLRKPAPAP